MPGCSVEREVVGSTAWFRISGKFEGACAWDVTRRLEAEPLGEAVLDFSQVADFSDYGIAVVAGALLSLPQKNVSVRGLRQHQERVFKCFGVDPEALHHSGPLLALPTDEPLEAADKVA